MADETMQTTLKYGVFLVGVPGYEDEPIARFSHEELARTWAREHHERFVVRPLEQPPRAIIRAFAAAMERKLAANDGKDSWKSWNRFDLLVLLNHEVIELQDAINDMLHDEMAGRPTRPDDVLSECVDVSLYAMMICDVVGALPPTDERGR